MALDASNSFYGARDVKRSWAYSKTQYKSRWEAPAGPFPMKELIVIVNGRKLNDGEVMTMRVALQVLLTDLRTPDALGTDNYGKEMQTAYLANANSLLEILFP